MGAIRRETDNDGNQIVIGSVIVHEGRIWSKAGCQEELMKNMDDICRLKLDYGLHSHSGVVTNVSGHDFFWN